MNKKALLAAVKDAYKHWPLEVLLSLSSLLSPSSACLLQEIQELNALLQSKGVDKGVDNTSASDLLSPQDQESKTPDLLLCVRIDLLFAVGTSAILHDDLAEGGLLSPHDASLFTFENCSFPSSPAKLEGNCLLLCARGSRFDFVLADKFLSAFPPLDSLLSPQDSAASFDLSATLPRQLSTENKLSPSLSPLKPTNLQLDIKLAMDREALCRQAHFSSRLATCAADPHATLTAVPAASEERNDRIRHCEVFSQD